MRPLSARLNSYRGRACGGCVETTQDSLERARRKEATKRQEEMIEVLNMEVDTSADAEQLPVRPHPCMHWVRRSSRSPPVSPRSREISTKVGVDSALRNMV